MYRRQLKDDGASQRLRRLDKRLHSVALELDRFSSAILLFLFAGVASVATWLLWRPSREPDVAFTAASLISLAYWTPFFYVPCFLPIASYWAGIPGHEPR